MFAKTLCIGAALAAFATHTAHAQTYCQNPGATRTLYQVTLGALGGLAGNQIGKGNGNKLAIALGAGTGVVLANNMANTFESGCAQPTQRHAPAVAQQVQYAPSAPHMPRMSAFMIPPPGPTPAPAPGYTSGNQHTMQGTAAAQTQANANAHAVNTPTAPTIVNITLSPSGHTHDVATTGRPTNHTDASEQACTADIIALDEQGWNSLDPEDRTQAMDALQHVMSAHRPGESHRWFSPLTNSAGTLTAGVVRREGSVACRDYMQSIETAQDLVFMTGKSCRMTDGSWIPAQGLQHPPCT